MSMDFSNTIQGFNADFNLNAIKDYNKYLQRQASFDMETESSSFAQVLDRASKSAPLKDSNVPSGVGNFMNNIGLTFGNGINAVNNAKLYSERLEEDLAMGGNTSIHEAMIAAEKASLSMQMAVQVRNKILNAYTEINSMAL